MRKIFLNHDFCLLQLDLQQTYVISRIYSAPHNIIYSLFGFGFCYGKKSGRGRQYIEQIHRLPIAHLKNFFKILKYLEPKTKYPINEY